MNEKFCDNFTLMLKNESKGDKTAFFILFSELIELKMNSYSAAISKMINYSIAVLV
jgi:hypothetical protein